MSNPWSAEGWDLQAQADFVARHGIHYTLAYLRRAGLALASYSLRPGTRGARPGEGGPPRVSRIWRLPVSRPEVTSSGVRTLPAITFDFSVLQALDSGTIYREIDIILNPGAVSLSAHYGFGLDHAHGGFGSVRHLNVNAFRFGASQSSPVLRERNFPVPMDMGFRENAVQGNVRLLEAAIALGANQRAEFGNIPARAGVGFAQSVAFANTKLLQPTPALGFNLEHIFSNTKNFSVAFDMGASAQPVLGNFRFLTAEHSLGFAAAAVPSQTQFISANPGLGLTLAEQMANEKYLAAIAALGLNVAEFTNTERNTIQDMALGFSASAAPYLPFNMAAISDSVGASMAATVTPGRNLSASASLGASMASTVQAIAPLVALALTYKDKTHTNNQSSGTFTFPTLAFGTASADRWIFVLFAAKNTVARTLTGVTIGGVTATVETLSGSLDQSQGLNGIAFANVPSGTTGSVVLTFSGGFTATVSNGVGIDWFTVVGDLNPTASDTLNVNTNANVSKTFTLPKGGVAFVIGNPTGNGDIPRSEGGVFTKDDDYVQFVGGVWRYAGHAVNSSVGSSATRAFSSVAWSTSAAAIPATGRAYGPNGA